MTNNTAEDLFEKDLIIDETNLSEDFIKQPSLLAFYGMAYQNAAAARRAAETALEITMAEVAVVGREKLSEKGIKATEAVMNEVIKSSLAFRTAAEKVDKLRADEGSLRIQYEAIQEKGKMLMSYGGVRRAELESNVRMLTTGGR